jgi:hypothetical protein
MKAQKKRCPSCGSWIPDGGGWGICRNLMPAQDVWTWPYGGELTFRAFGCVYHKAKKATKKPICDRCGKAYNPLAGYCCCAGA